jgi:hypothetical protein
MSLELPKSGVLAFEEVADSPFGREWLTVLEAAGWRWHPHQDAWMSPEIAQSVYDARGRITDKGRIIDNACEEGSEADAQVLAREERKGAVDPVAAVMDGAVPPAQPALRDEAGGAAGRDAPQQLPHLLTDPCTRDEFRQRVAWNLCTCPGGPEANACASCRVNALEILALVEDAICPR